MPVVLYSKIPMPAVPAAAAVHSQYKLMTEAFTYEQAEEIAEDFEDLKDTEFLLGGVWYFVEDVLVAPSGIPLDGPEMQQVRLGLYQPDETGDFDVLIAASGEASGGITTYIDIRSYMLEKGVSYNMPGE